MVYLYDKASPEDWNNYKNHLEQKLKASNQILSLLQNQHYEEEAEFTVQEGKFEPKRNARYMEKHLQAQSSYSRKHLPFSQ
ncbi:19547_t:CDS:2 [Gigaspora rosea]|nr:19547_t:CDS:2 [Gigaspora rosea]